MALRGDFSKLERLVGELKEAANRKTMADVTKIAEKGVLEQYQADFVKQQDPWGESWAPNKDGHTPVGFRTGNMANPQVTSTSGTVRLRNAYYAHMFQVGVNGAPQRGVVPYSPSGWDPPIQDAISDRIVAIFKTAE